MEKDYSDMRVIYRDEPNPTLNDINRMWDEIAITPLPNGPAVEEWVAVARSCFVNGTAFFHRFLLPVHPVLQWLVSWDRVYRNSQLGAQINYGNFWSNFVKHVPIPELQGHTLGPLAVEGTQWLSSYLLDGTIAWHLKGGGAYQGFEGSAREAKALGLRVYEELIGDEPEEVLVFQLFVGWSSFFYEVGWDTTFLGLNKRTREAWIYCATDTD